MTDVERDRHERAVSVVKQLIEMGKPFTAKTVQMLAGVRLDEAGRIVSMYFNRGNFPSGWVISLAKGMGKGHAIAFKVYEFVANREEREKELWAALGPSI